MKGMADSLGDLGWPVEDRILVLNVLRGLSDRYSYLRTWITRQRPFPTFLQVRDDLVMEELTQGLQPGSTFAPESSSSLTALAATPPPRPAPPPQSSLLGPLPRGPSGGRVPWRTPSPWQGTWSRSWGQHDAATSTGCTLAILPQPMVRAHLHVAVPGSRWRASPAGGHARWCFPGVSLCDPVDGTHRACRLGPGGLGALFQHHGPDSSSWAGVGRRLWGYLPHHS